MCQVLRVLIDETDSSGLLASRMLGNLPARGAPADASGISNDATHEASDARRARAQMDESWAVLGRWCFEATPTLHSLA